MSGLEIVGVILGAFPLAITAMEHYEETKKVAGTFFKIRRAHRKDFGKVKDCQLKFRLNMKELLLPLLTDDVVTKMEYEQLLALPGGPGWQEEHVEDSLAERLGDCYERYIEILKEMEETMVLLCKATKVDDKQFQKLLETQNTIASTPFERARSKLMLRSFASLQAKKVAYAFTIPQRDALLEEIEGFNTKLESVLVANDRILTRQSVPTPSKPRIPKSLLQFWRHAACMFKLINEAWKCQCKGVHCAKLWLKQRIVATVDMKVMLQFCHGARKCVHIQLAENPVTGSTGSNSAVSIRLPLRPISQQQIVPAITIQHTSAIAKTSGSAASVTVTRTSSRVSWAHQHQQPATLPSQDLSAKDLCETMKAACSTTSIDGCYGGLTDHDTDHYYTVSNINNPSDRASTANATLCDIFDGKTSVVLTRMQRYSIAATLASSLLQLETTPWAQKWESSDVHFAQDVSAGQVTTLEYDKPFFLARFDATSIAKDDSFKALGTLLLELCFGKALDQHVLWQQPAFAMAKTNPMLRHFVACEWIKDVEGEAGEQYGNAVKFCLQQAPTTLKDDKWRVDFAQSVVWPLQQCHESMQPSKR